MTFLRSLLPVVVAPLLVGVIACLGTTELAPTSTFYFLQSVGETPLPFFVHASGSDTTSLLAETLTLRSNGLATIRQQIRIVQSGRAPDTSSYTLRYGYVVKADTIVLSPDCGPGANCIDSWGVLAGPTLRLKGYLGGDDHGPSYLFIGPVFEFFTPLPD